MPQQAAPEPQGRVLPAPAEALADGLVAAAELAVAAVGHIAGDVAEGPGEEAQHGEPREPEAQQAAEGAEDEQQQLAARPQVGLWPARGRPPVDWEKLARASLSIIWLLLGLLVCWLLWLLPWRPAFRTASALFASITAAADTTAVVFTAASNLTSAVALLSVDGLQESRTFMHEAIRGIEIYDLNSAAVGHTIVATSAKALGEWLLENGTVHNVPQNFVERWLPQIRRFDQGFLQVELSHSMLNTTSGIFSWGLGEIKRLSRHSVGLRFVMVHSSFTLGWTNPVWDLMGVPAASENDQVMELLTKMIEQHPLHKQYLAAAAWNTPQRRWW